MKRDTCALNSPPSRSALLVGNMLSSNRPGTFSFDEALASRLSAGGWKVLTTSDKTVRLRRLVDMLLTTWRGRHRYAVAKVSVFSGPAFFWAEAVSWLLRQLGKPLVLTLHGGNLPAFGKRWPGRVRRLLNSASVVTTPSRYLQDALRSYRNDILLLPNAIDLNAYSFRLRSNPKPKLVWLRALHGIYNPCMAVRTVAHLLEMGNLGSPTSDLRPPTSDLHLSMFGPEKGDGTLQRLKAEIQKLKLGERVRLEGPVAKPDVPKALNSGDIFLNTTNYESYGVSVMEAAACGLCIVSTNVGELPLLWQDGHDALLVNPDDSAAMAAAVRRILTEPGQAECLSRNARAKAEQCDWSVILPRWEQLLNKAAGNGSRDNRTLDN